MDCPQIKVIKKLIVMKRPQQQQSNAAVTQDTKVADTLGQLSIGSPLIPPRHQSKSIRSFFSFEERHVLCFVFIIYPHTPLLPNCFNWCHHCSWTLISGQQREVFQHLFISIGPAQRTQRTLTIGGKDHCMANS